MGVSHNVGDDLLLITVSVDPAHNGNVDLDIPGRELQQVQFVAVAAAVVIQRKGAGEARNVPLPFQTCAVQIFLFGDLHHQPLEQLGVALSIFLHILNRQADIGDGVDEEQGIALEQALCLHALEDLAGMEHGDPFDLIQAACLMGQLHDLSGGVQGRQIDPHEGLVGCDPAAAGRVDGLEVVGHQLLLQQERKVLLGLGGVCLLMVAADIKITHAALVGMLDLIHGKVGIFFQGEQVVAVRGVPGNAARDADVQLLAVGQDGHAALQGSTQQLQLGAELLLILVAIEEDQEFIARKAGADGVGGRIGRKALAGLADVLVAPVVAVGIVDLLEVVQIHHQQGGTAQLFGLLEQRVTGAVKGTAAVQAGQGIVIALVLNALLLQHRGGHILSKTHLGDAFT